MKGLRLAAAVLSVLVLAYTATAFRVAADGGGAWNDDAAYRYQAKCFAIGRISVPQPPEYEAFQVPSTTSFEGRCFGKYYPALPAMLAVGERLGAPWAIGPLLAALLVAGTFLLGRDLVSPRVGWIAAVLLAASPWFLNLSTTYLSHVPAAAAFVASAVATVRARRRGSIRWGLVAGASWGIGFLARPLTGLALALPFGIAAVRDLVVEGRRPVRWIIPFSAAAAVAGGVALAWNAALTGDPLTSAYSISKPADSFGLESAAAAGGPRRGPYTVDVARGTLDAQLTALTRFAFPVPLPARATPFLVLPLLLPFLDRSRRGVAGLMLLACVVLPAAHFPYPGTRGISATIFGPRYYFSAAPAFFVLTAWTLDPIARRVTGPRRIAAAFALAAGVLALSFTNHWRYLERLHENPLAGQTSRLEAWMHTLPRVPRIVFVDISTYSELAATLANRPDLEGDDLVAIYRQPDQNRAVLDAFPGREALLVRWPAGGGTPAATPYVPEADTCGPPPRAPYVGPRGLRFPPPGERQASSADNASEQ